MKTKATRPLTIALALRHYAATLAVACLAWIPDAAHAAAFTPGNLAVLQTTESDSNSPATIIELSPTTANQTPGNSISIPGTGATAMRFSASASSTGYVARTNDATLLTFTGANSADTTTNVNALNPRGVGVLDAAGTFSISTTYMGANGNQTRGASSLNNTTWFIADQGGLYTNGATTASPTGNFRAVKSFGGIVYAFTASTSFPPVGTFAAATGATFTGLPGLANGASSRQDFHLISSGTNGTAFDVLYILDSTSNTAGTVFKYSLVGGSWTANGTYTTTFGGFGLAASKSGSGATLYVSTGLGALTNNSVIKLTDTAGYNATISITTANNVTLYTATGGTIIKGVAFAPVAAPALQADLAVSVTSPATSPSGANFDYSIVAANNGTAAATGVAVDFTIPAGLNFVSATGGSGFTGVNNAGVVQFTGGSLNAGTNFELKVTVNPTAANTYTAPVGAAVIDPLAAIAESNEGNNSSPVAAATTVLAASNNANLSNLVLSTGAYSPTFAQVVTNYVKVVPNGSASLTVTPTKADANATITVNSTPVASGVASVPIALNEGFNTITTVVTAEDGTTTKTYTATVIRQSNAVLGPGSIAFTGFNAEGTDNLAFVALQDIPANTVIFFTDDEWNGTDWADNAESAFAWTSTSAISAGTIVTIDDASNIYGGTPLVSSNLGIITGIPDAIQNPGVSASDEAISAFQGTGDLNANGNEVPTAFLALIANEDPAGGAYSLTGTGLSEAAGTAIIFTEDDDGMRYIGTRNGKANFSEYLPLLADRVLNWESVGGGDGTTLVPFNPAPFTAGPTVPVTINDVSVSEGDGGTTMLTFTVTRTNNTGAFTLNYATADGTGLNGATLADNDYQSGTGLITFTVGGPLTQPVTVLINGDVVIERNETFFVNLSGLVSTVGNAVISDIQGVGTILTDDPAAPSITTQPASQSIAIGAKATLNVVVEGFPIPTFQWYAGASGDTANPVASATSATFVTPVLLAPASYWVRVSNSQGSVDSNTANISVSQAAPYSNATIDITTPNTASWNPAGVNVGGTQFINLGLQGVGRVPASTIDPATGESLGSISDMQISGWRKNADGSYSGTMNTLPDRGFNATAPTTIFSNYAARINSFAITFTPYTSATPTTAQNQIAMTFTGSTRFTYDNDGLAGTPPVFTTGLLANGGVSLFGATVPVGTGPSTQSDGTVTDRLTLDSEGLILDSRLGKSGSGWIGDEYGAYIYHFNSAKQIDGLVTLPAALLPHAVAGGPISFIDVPANVDGRRVNQGMEGIAQSPDGTLLFGLMQSATMQDSGSGNQGRFNTRLLVYNISSSDTPTDPIAQYVIQLPRIDDTGSTANGTSVNRTGAQSSILALNDHQLLILSRDGNGRGVPGSASPVFKSILLADLSTATNIDGTYDAAGNAVAPLGALAPTVTPISWTEALNMIGKLGSSIAEVEKFGLNLSGGNGDINTICEKWESLGLVSANDPANPNDYFLFIGNDNDFLTSTGKYLDNSGLIQSYDAGLENDTLVLAYRVRMTGAFNQAPFVSNSIPNQSGSVGTPFSFAFAANTFTDPEGGTLTYTATKADDTALPAWLSFNPATRTFSGTPTLTDLGALIVKVRATDNGTPNLSITTSFSITINHSVRIAAASVTEGNAGTVTLSLPVTRSTTTTEFTVNYAVTGGTATAGTDYVTLSAGTLTFNAGGPATQTIDITVNGDTTLESSETIAVTLSGLVNVTGTTVIGTATASGTIINDDTIPVVYPATNALTSTVKGSILLAGAEIPAFDPLSKRAFASSNAGIQVVDLTNPAAPALITTITPASLGVPGLTSNDVTSVTVRKGTGANPSVLAAAILSSPKTLPGYVIFLDAATGALLGSTPVGANPDNLSFTPDGTKVLVANEGEVDGTATDVAADTTLGSVSIIDVTGGFASPTVNTADFTAYDSQVATLRAAGVRIYNNGTTDATPSRDFEPEYVAISPDGTRAMVTIQEANAVAVLDIASATFTSVHALGKKDFSPLRLDFSDRDGPGASQLVNPTTGNPVFGLYMPDAIASYTFGGQTYYVAANEGDDRNDFVTPDESTVAGAVDYVLDPTKFPNAAALKNNAVLGRLTVSNSPGLRGDTDGDGDIDEILSYGGRSFSILDAAGNRVFDSGDMIDLIVMSQHFSNFDDSRSDNKGSEPEGVTIATFGSRTYAFIGLERSHMVLVFDVTDPGAVTYTTAFKRAGDLNPEGLVVVSASDSPSGRPLLITANEVSNTLTIFEINQGPVLTLPPSPFLAEATSASGANVVFSVTANDPEEGAIAPTVLPPSGSLFPLGDTVVNVSATDSAGATTTGSFIVRVVDTTNPTIDPPAGGFTPLALSTNILPNYVPQAVTSDNVLVTSVTQSPIAGSTLSVGPTLVTLTGHDAAGNTASTSFTVTVMLTAPTLTELVSKDSPVPGAGIDPRIPAGSLFRTFGIPAVNDAGQYAVLGNWIKSGKTGAGIFAGNLLALKAAHGEVAPGTDGAVFATFYDPALDRHASGTPDVTFLATISKPSGASTPLIVSTNDSGIWTTLGGSLALVAREGGTAPDTGGAIFKTLTSHTMVDGEILVGATLSTTTAGVTTGTDVGIWRWTPAGGLRLVLREGQTVPSLTGPKTVKVFQMLGTVSLSAGHGRHHLSAGHYAVRVTCDDKTIVNYLIDATGTSPVFTPAVQSGQTLFPHLTASTIGVPSGNSSGELAFTEVFKSVSGFASSKNNGAIISNRGGGWHIVVRESNTASPGVTWGKLYDPVINEAGDVAWVTKLGGASSSDNVAIGWSPAGNSPELVAREGFLAPDCAGAVFGAFSTISLPDGGLGPLFTATLRSSIGGVSSANDSGLWGMDSTGAVRLLLREGQTVGTKTLKSFTVLANVDRSPGQTRSFNEDHTVIVRLTFSDASQSIATITVP